MGELFNTNRYGNIPMGVLYAVLYAHKASSKCNFLWGRGFKPGMGAYKTEGKGLSLETGNVI